MLSILIPVFNTHVGKLVSDLHDLASKAQIAFEIRCYDNGSSAEYIKANESIGNLENVVYHLNNANTGRASIRNQLARDAQYEYLLFLDGDMKILSSEFIYNYLKNTRHNTVLCGGIAYEATPPDNSKLLLRWHYGREREALTAKERNTKPYRSFMTGNFFLPKAIFNSVKFDESLKIYGHEDTLFGLDLKRTGIPVVHIDNPTLHDGLEDADLFIAKTEQGVENLYTIYKKGLLQENSNEIKLLKYFKKVKQYRLDSGLRILFDLTYNKLVKLLKKPNPNVSLLDLYKLGYLLKISEAKKPAH